MVTPSKGLTGMSCPRCGKKTRITRSSEPTLGTFERERKCPDGHTFRTFEEVRTATLKEVGVRAGGDGAALPTVHPLSPARLQEELARAAFFSGVGDQLEIREITTEAVARILRGEGIRLQIADREEILAVRRSLRQVHPSVRFTVRDTDIIDLIDSVMEDHERLRMPRVLYALVFAGRNDREGRKGWDRAEQFLVWLHKSFQTLDQDIPLRVATPRALFWRIGTIAPDSYPSRVIKRRFSSKRGPAPSRNDSRIADFNFPQYERSVQRFLFARQDAARKAEGVIDFVLTSLAGQDVVTTSQLAFGTLAALRRVDEIAYLRAASTTKRFLDVSSVRDEAVGLLRHPSPRLEFRTKEEWQAGAASAGNDRKGARASTPVMSYLRL
ncbi:hypothetical protein ACPW96_21100 [Micromonospora sp. DT81.3]|uniref:hypothetical protein n=1 Tax=Micromonospora sp. DT81.3 TaxID=3416523 RepID=UPI003CE85443